MSSTDRELDIQVAERVFGYLVELDRDGPRYSKPGSASYIGQHVPHYSTRIAAAMSIVAQIGGCFDLSYDPSAHRDRWLATFEAYGAQGSAANPAEAICRAALEVMGVADRDAAR